MKFEWTKQLPDGTNVSLLECRKNESGQASDMAAQAINFVRAYDRCLEDRRIAGYTSWVLPLQAAMCGTFGIELGFKALLTANSIPIPRDTKTKRKTHNLHTLYQSLPEDVKDQLSSAVELPTGAFNQMLLDISRLFERARYSHEEEELTVDLNFLHTLIVLIEPLLWKTFGREPPGKLAGPEEVRAMVKGLQVSRKTR